MSLLAFDFETAGGETKFYGSQGKPRIKLDSRKATIKLLSYATETESGLLTPEEWPILLPILADHDVVKIGHNLAYDLGLLRAAVGHRFLAVNLFDTMLAYQLLIAGLYDNSLNKSSLKNVVEEVLGEELDKSLQVSDWSGVHTPEQLQYALRDSKILIPLYHALREQLEDAGLTRVAQIEFDCIPMTVEVTHTGLPIDIPALEEKISSLHAEIEAGEKQLAEMAKGLGWISPNHNKRFNPASPQHLKSLMQLVYGEEAVPDASEGTIKALVEAFPDKTLAGLIRDLKKSETQFKFLKSWLLNHEEGRIYSGYIQLGTRTGRYTSQMPNAQQIDKTLRYLFKPMPGRALVECDYSNIEMRLAAEISKEPTLLELYRNGADVHKVTASKVFHVPEDQVTPEQRKTAKIINFGALYGGGAHYLMEALPGLAEAEARSLLDAFRMSYPGLLTYWDRCKNKSLRMVVNGKEYSVARSALGRLEYIPRQDESTRKRHKRLNNRLVNVPIQATGVDLFKLALGMLYSEFCKPEYADFQFLLSLHDSVLLECPESRAEECADLVNSVFMIAAREIFQDAPCKADVKIGDNWGFVGKAGVGA
jgi:DNA polymerase-1